MKTHLFILLSIISVSFGFSQTQPKLDNYPFGDLDVNVVIFPFGMENPIKIGTMSKSGEIHFEFPKELPKVSITTEENFMSEVAYTVFNECVNWTEIISEKENVPSFKSTLSLATSNNPYAAVIFAVSDEDLMPWMDSASYEEPISGSYFELIHVAAAFQYKGECIQTIMSMSDDPDMEIAYSFDLNLKAGFNFMKYKIESIHKTDPEVRASFPDKVMVTSVEGIPNCKWVGKYF